MYFKPLHRLFFSAFFQVIVNVLKTFALLEKEMHQTSLLTFLDINMNELEVEINLSNYAEYMSAINDC